MLQRDSFFGRQPAKAPAPVAATSVKPGNGVVQAAPAPAPRIDDAGKVPAADSSVQALRGTAIKGEGTHGSQLIVGPNIRMKGVEISDCDTLVVEGHIEATMESRMIQIAPEGTYSGTAGIDSAEIRGAFSGELTVRKCLTIYASGSVSGKIRYRKLVVEEGGEIAGEIVKLADEDKSARPSASGPAAPAPGVAMR